MKYAYCPGENNATQLMVIVEYYGEKKLPMARKAEVKVPRMSRSGKTEWFSWIEDGAICAVRWSPDAMLKFHDGVPEDREFVAFTGPHGVINPGKLFIVDAPKYNAALSAWREFRKTGNALPPAPEDQFSRMARQVSFKLALAGVEFEGQQRAFTDWEVMGILPRMFQNEGQAYAYEEGSSEWAIIPINDYQDQELICWKDPARPGAWVAKARARI